MLQAWLKALMFEIVVIEQSWGQILSRTSVLRKPQMIQNQHFFSLDKITLFALHTIECYKNMGNLRSMKGKKLVKQNQQC